jgi:hypothetical protein
MIGTPLDVLPYVRGIQLILTGYSGYSKGKRKHTDQIIRDEIIRAGGRVRSHMQNVHDVCFQDNDITSARAAKKCMEECDMLANDVDKSSTGMDHAFLSGQRSTSGGDLKKLVKHDHEVIEMITAIVPNTVWLQVRENYCKYYVTPPRRCPRVEVSLVQERLFCPG